MLRVNPSGEQFEFSWQNQRCVVVEVGGGVRSYEVDERAVLDPYPVEAVCDGAHGAPLIPWPNRLADGRYDFDGRGFQVALTEPEKHNAIHGLLRWRAWRMVRRTNSTLTMGVHLFPMPGYPFSLEVELHYSLDERGLTVTTTATNTGESPCPYGCGQHPYLSAGNGKIDECRLHFDASTRLLTDDQRQLPTGHEPVAGSPYDFREPKLLGAQRIDYAFYGLARDQEGRAWVRLEGTDARRAELWVDESYPIIELYTGDTLAPERRRRGLGTEPMTCLPNAFQSGEGVQRLEPGQSAHSTWGARLQ